MISKKLINTVLFMILSTTLLAQGGSNISIKFKTISILPTTNKNHHLFGTKLDTYGHFVFEPGVALSFSQFVHENILAIKLEEAIYMDPAGQVSAYTHLGLRFRLQRKRGPGKKNRHTFHIGIGPVIYYRSSWATLDDYKTEDYVNGKDNMQYMFWVMAEAEYDYAIRKRLDFSVSLNYGFMSAINLQAGFKFWVSKKFKRDCGCT